MGMLNRLFGRPLPADPLERALMAHATGAGSMRWLEHELSGANVFVLLHGDAAAVENGAPLRPLVVSTPTGETVACLFTSAEQAEELQHQHPECGGGRHVDFAWVLATLPDGYGFVINPGHPAFLFQSAEDVARLKGDLADPMRAAA